MELNLQGVVSPVCSVLYHSLWNAVLKLFTQFCTLLFGIRLHGNAVFLGSESKDTWILFRQRAFIYTLDRLDRVDHTCLPNIII